MDIIHFYEISLFSLLTGNADMHLKNFSLLTTPEADIMLSPSYDLLCTKIAIPDDMEEMALTLNGRKRKIHAKDFEIFAKNLKIPDKAIQRIQLRFREKLKTTDQWIDNSFLPDDLKTSYKKIVNLRTKQINLD